MTRDENQAFARALQQARNRVNVAIGKMYVQHRAIECVGHGEKQRTSNA